MLAFAVGIALLVTALLAGPAGGSPQGSLKKGGTLRVDLRGDWDKLTCRKLLDVSDGRAATLVSDAAVSVPVVSRDSKTYTFRIRKGLKYSTGKALTARDFAYAIDFNADPKLSSPATVFMKEIARVQTLGRYELRIRLTRAAPDFLARMSMPAFCAIPPGTPHNPNAAIPSAGPYYIASSTPARTVLKRNPFYKGSRLGNPDQIVFNDGVPLVNQRLRCEHDEADVCGFPPEQAAELKAKYGVNRGRFFVKPQTTLLYLALNHDRDLFRNNDKLARAINYAVDRPAILRRNGALGGLRTDQILPPGVPGFRNWNLYPLKGPDYKTARRLAKGNLRGGKCQLWTFNNGFGPTAAQVVTLNLKQIGLDCDITSLDRADEVTKAGTRGAGFDIALVGWNENYPDPYDFLNALLDGTQIKVRNNTNLSYFDDPRVDRLLAAAAGKSGRARRRAYSLLDRDLMRDAAPIAPLFVSQETGTLVSSRVGCFTSNAVYGIELGALCLDQQSAKLTVTVANAQGVVTSDPAGISCETTCSRDFAYGETVTLTAIPEGDGSLFVEWTGDCTGDIPRCTVTLNGAKDVRAVFRKKRHTLSVSKTGTGTGAVASSPAGIDCGATCSTAYDIHTNVTLTATAGAGSTFTGWSGGGCSGSGTCTVAMDGDTTVTATFTANPDHLAFTLQPASAQAGDATISAQVTVEDASNNPVTTATNDVTLALGTNPSGGTLSGTTTKSAVNGVAAFSGLSVDKVGSGYTVEASAAGLTAATSHAFDVVLCGQPVAAAVTIGGLQFSGRCSASVGWHHTVLTAPSGKMFFSAIAHASSCTALFPSSTMTCGAPPDGVLCVAAVTTSPAIGGDAVTATLEASDDTVLETDTLTVADSGAACSTS